MKWFVKKQLGWNREIINARPFSHKCEEGCFFMRKNGDNPSKIKKILKKFSVKLDTTEVYEEMGK